MRLGTAIVATSLQVLCMYAQRRIARAKSGADVIPAPNPTPARLAAMHRSSPTPRRAGPKKGKVRFRHRTKGLTVEVRFPLVKSIERRVHQNTPVWHCFCNLSLSLRINDDIP
jgi:hypothetical protein